MKIPVLLTISIILSFFVFGISYAQETDEELKYKPDTIYKLGRGKIICTIKNIGVTKIRYFYQKNPDESFEIKRKQVQKIVYGNGKIEEYNDPLMAMVDENSWEAVWVTEKEDDVSGLHFIKTLKIESESRTRSLKAAKNNAYIKLKKKTSGDGGHVALIKTIEAKGGYGDFPSYFIEADVYSWNPPADK